MATVQWVPTMSCVFFDGTNAQEILDTTDPSTDDYLVSLEKDDEGVWHWFGTSSGLSQDILIGEGVWIGVPARSGPYVYPDPIPGYIRLDAFAVKSA